MAGLFGSPSPKAPVIIPAPIIPTENTTAVTAAQTAELQAAAARSGRASTILSQNDIAKQSTGNAVLSQNAIDKTDTMGG